MDKNKFQERLKLLYSSWDDCQNQNLWKKTKILVVFTHPKHKSLRSSSFFNWLLGYNSGSILLVVSKEYVYIICDENIKDVLIPLEKYAVLHPKVIVEGKGRDLLTDRLNSILKKVTRGNLSHVRSGGIELGLVIGYIKSEGCHLSSKLKMVEKNALEWKDVTNGFAKVMKGNVSCSGALKESEVGNEGMEKEGMEEKVGEKEPEKDSLKEIIRDDKDNELTNSKDNGLSSAVALKESEVENEGMEKEGEDKKDGENESEKNPLKEISGDGKKNDWTDLKDNGSSSDALKESEVGNERMEKERKDKKDCENESEKKDPLKEIRAHLKDNGSSSNALKESEVGSKGDGNGDDDWEFVREEDPWEFVG